MKFLVKTQVLAILFSILWAFYVNVLAFFDQPERGLEYINYFVYGFAMLLGTIYFLLTKYLIGRKWLALPLILIPFFIIYQPAVLNFLLKMMKDGNGDIIHFLWLSTGTVHLMALIFGLAFGILFSRLELKD